MIKISKESKYKQVVNKVTTNDRTVFICVVNDVTLFVSLKLLGIIRSGQREHNRRSLRDRNHSQTVQVAVKT